MSVDVARTTEEAQGMLASDIAVDPEGDWTYQGNPIIREDIIEFFLDNLQLTPEGKYLIVWKQQRCLLEAADTPFVVARVDRRQTDDHRDEILLRLKHASAAEPLDPASLRVGEANVLYCRVRGGRFPARFSRPAYYQLADWISEDPQTGGFCLELNGRRTPIRL